MTKVISFSLWGDNPCYNYGALENDYLASKIYPGWICRFYVSNDIRKDVKKQLEKLKNTQVVVMPDLTSFKKLIWRFLPAFKNPDDIVIVRDTDSRLNMKEKLAIYNRLKSDRDFHIMRDRKSKHHHRIMGGMWGDKNGVLLPLKTQFQKFYHNTSDTKYNCDQNFLADIIYPFIRNKSIIHNNFHEFKDERVLSFPKINYPNFVGNMNVKTSKILTKS